MKLEKNYLTLGVEVKDSRDGVRMELDKKK